MRITVDLAFKELTDVLAAAVAANRSARPSAVMPSELPKLVASVVGASLTDLDERIRARVSEAVAERIATSRAARIVPEPAPRARSKRRKSGSGE